MAKRASNPVQCRPRDKGEIFQEPGTDSALPESHQNISSAIIKALNVK